MQARRVSTVGKELPKRMVIHHGKRRSGGVDRMTGSAERDCNGWLYSMNEE
jgi:hypothetical protein